jgi:hypothetical protein
MRRHGVLVDGFDDTGVMADPGGPDFLLCAHVSEPDCYQVMNPRLRWRREADFTGWLAGNLDQLASCLGVQRLHDHSRESVIGERWTAPGRRGYEQTVGGMRLDLAARDDRGRLVVIEAQFGPADHDHLGKLITYACTVEASLAVWVVADTDPVFYAEHLVALAELNSVFAGRREFCVVAATVESTPTPVPPTPDTPCSPRLRRIDLQSHRAAALPAASAGNDG